MGIMLMLKISKLKVSASIAVLDTTITDHFTILLCLSKIRITKTANKIKKTVDFEVALNYLKEKKLSDLLYCDDPNTLIDLLTGKLTEAINISTTVTKIPYSKRIRKPWITWIY